MEITNEQIQIQHRKTNEEKMKNLEEFLDDHPDRCRYQYNKRDYGKGWLHKFCGWPTAPGSKLCHVCQQRKSPELILPSCEQSDWYIN